MTEARTKLSSASAALAWKRACDFGKSLRSQLGN